MLSGPEFEQEVVRTARAVWAAPAGNAGSMLVDGRERDLIYETEDVVHYVECTISRKLDKLRSDAVKLVKYREKLGGRGKLVKLWFITQEEPTADQRTLAKENRIVAVSLHDFRRKFFDADRYLEARAAYQFGSAANPATDSTDVSAVPYLAGSLREEDSPEPTNVDCIVDALIAQSRVLLLGDFGMGKSMTVREVWRGMKKRRKGDPSVPCPVAINLREHWGQEDAYEVLERHARRLGTDPRELVRAFNMGAVCLLLDGFDEVVGGQIWQTRSDRLVDVRRDSLRLVRELVEKSKGRVGVLLVGREHFFDSAQEMRSALGLVGGASRCFRMSEFSEEQSDALLREHGIDAELPDWLPRRPLLLATLVARGFVTLLLKETVEPCHAWSELVEAICERESRIHQLLDGPAIRQILERLASVARKTSDGLGPVKDADIAAHFQAIVGTFPDEKARVLLARLPGLSARSSEEGHRYFIDDSMLDILRAGDVRRFAENPYADPDAHAWQHGLGLLGTELGADGGPKQVGAWVAAAREATNRWGAPTLAADLVGIARVASDEEVDFAGLEIPGAAIGSIDLTEGAVMRGLRFKDALIGTISLPATTGHQVAFEQCIIARSYGCSSPKELPLFFRGCEVQEFESPETNAALLAEGDVPLRLRVLFTVLRKLYVQRGRGRKEAALSRGLPPGAREHVDGVLGSLAAEGLAHPIKLQDTTVWQPAGKQRARAHAILRERVQSKDPLVTRILAENGAV